MRVLLATIVSLTFLLTVFSSGVNAQVCGDGVCNREEDTLTCPGDCVEGNCTQLEPFLTCPFAENTVNKLACQKDQIHFGVYDHVSQRTFVVYPAGEKDGLSASSPYIIYYDHNTREWSQPKEIMESPVDPDGHYYPQILIDDEGYLHVFHTFHGYMANYPIMHAVSRNPRDIGEWDISYISDSNGATYGAAFKAKNGDLYLFSRIREVEGVNYEPEYYIKSTDNGNTWASQKVIDPVPYDDGWGTIYTKAMHYEEDPEGLYITFGVHKNHNQFFDKHFLIFFSFQDNHIYSPVGVDLGIAVNRSEYEQYCEIFRYGEDVPFFTTTMAVDLGDDGNPHVFYNRMNLDLQFYLEAAVWQNGNWEFHTLSEPGTQIRPWRVEVSSIDDFKLYATVDMVKAAMYRVEGESVDEYVIFESHGGDKWVTHMSFIDNYHPELKGMFFEGERDTWTAPSPTGILYSFSDDYSYPVCGNGICEPGEDIGNCQEDCNYGIKPIFHMFSGTVLSEAQKEFAAENYWGIVIGKFFIGSSIYEEMHYYNPNVMLFGYVNARHVAIGSPRHLECEPANGGDEALFAHNETGDRIINMDFNSYLMDIENPDWAAKLAEWTNEHSSEVGGVFLDDATPRLTTSRYASLPAGYDECQYAVSMKDLLAGVKSNISRMLIFNGLRPALSYCIWTCLECDGYVDPVDGGVIEGFVFRPDQQYVNSNTFNNHVNALITMGKLGKMAHGGAESYMDNMTNRVFAVASHLLGINPYSTYSFGDLNVEGSSDSMQYYPEYDIYLGSPLDFPNQTADMFNDEETLIIRHFEAGMVIVNPFEDDASIDIPEGYSRIIPHGGGSIGSDVSYDGYLEYEQVPAGPLVVPAGSAILFGETFHRADTDPPYDYIDTDELVTFIDSWKYDSTEYPMWEMMEAVVMYYDP